MDWNTGYSALFELKTVDPISFADNGSFDFISGTIDRTNSGLMESGDLTMMENPGECLIRIYLKAKQGASGARIPIFTGLTSAPERKLDGKRITYEVECYSVLKPIDDILIPIGYYAPAGSDGTQLVQSLLSVGPAPVVVDDDGPYLAESIVAEDSQSRLDVAWMILKAIGWRLRIEGDGTIHICEMASASSAVFDMLNNDVIEPNVTDSQDWFSVPNCIRVINGSRYVEYIDDDAESSVSTVSRQATRGGTGQIWMSDSAAGLSSGESLVGYALRILSEAQSPARTIKYTRRFQPDIFVGDWVTLHLPAVGIDGIFKITKQSIELGYGCRTDEEVTQIE